jgi:hypothetical protein
MSLTKLSLAGNNLITSRLGTGMSLTFFYCVNQSWDVALNQLWDVASNQTWNVALKQMRDDALNQPWYVALNQPGMLH